MIHQATPFEFSLTYRICLVSTLSLRVTGVGSSRWDQHTYSYLNWAPTQAIIFKCNLGTTASRVDATPLHHLTWFARLSFKKDCILGPIFDPVATKITALRTARHYKFKKCRAQETSYLRPKSKRVPTQRVLYRIEPDQMHGGNCQLRSIIQRRLAWSVASLAFEWTRSNAS